MVEASFTIKACEEIAQEIVFTGPLEDLPMLHLGHTQHCSQLECTATSCMHPNDICQDHLLWSSSSSSVSCPSMYTESQCASYDAHQPAAEARYGSSPIMAKGRVSCSPLQETPIWAVPGCRKERHNAYREMPLFDDLEVQKLGPKGSNYG